MTITPQQIALTKQLAAPLKQLFRDALVSLLTGKAEEKQASPIILRLKALLEAAGEDPDTVLDEAWNIVTSRG